MRKLSYTGLFLIGYFCACSTTSVKDSQPLLWPPSMLSAPGAETAFADKSPNTSSRHPKGENARMLIQWLASYQKGLSLAVSQPEAACPLFASLAKQDSFPLVNLAKLHALAVCPDSVAGLPSIEDTYAHNAEPWLHDLLVQSLLARAQITGDKEWESKLSAEASKTAHPQRERIRLLTRAQTLAQELGHADLAAQLQKQLLQLAPRLQTVPRPEDYLAVAADFRQNRQFNEARSYYQKILDSNTSLDSEKYRALDGIRLSYKLEKKTADYLQAAHKQAEFTEHLLARKKTRLAWSPRYNDAHLLLARAVWTEGQPEAALQIAMKVAEQLKKTYPIDEAIWLQARIKEERGDFKGAAELYAHIGTDARLDSELRDRINWARGWVMHKAGNFKEAQKMFAQIADVEPMPFRQARARYWSGRMYQRMHQVDLAKTEFDWLIKNDPLGFYGILAYRELSLPLPPVIAKKNPEESNEQGQLVFSQPRDQAYFEWLIAVDEGKIASQFLSQVDRTLHSAGGRLSSETQFALLSQYARAGEYQGLFAKLSDLSAEARAELLEQDPLLLFPQPYRSEVLETATRFSVPPAYVYAIMRQESSFNPHARSNADAFGLMQVIPEVAEKSQSLTGLKISGPEDLYTPEINIVTGTAYLHTLIERYHQQFILATASYNASEKAVQGWMRNRFRGEPVEFIEDIPYEETKTYVKLVFRNFIFYQRMLSAGKAIPFPEEWFQLVGPQPIQPIQPTQTTQTTQPPTADSKALPASVPSGSN